MEGKSVNYEGELKRVCFVRKETVWIGNSREADLLFVGTGIRMCLKGNMIFWEKEGSGFVLHNGNEIDQKEFPISEGDIIEMQKVRIVVFQNRVEIESERPFISTLLPIQEPEKYFQGFPIYKRSPRIVYQEKKEKFEIKMPPAKKTMSKGSLAQLIIPSITMFAFTIAMSIFLKRGAYVYMSAGMTIITMIFSIQRYVSEKREMKQKNRRRKELYEEYLLNIRKKVNRLREEEKRTLSYQYPTIMELSRMAEQYSSRIYERTALDDDFLKVNLGYCKERSKIEVVFSEKELNMEQDELVDKAKMIPKEYEKISGVPVTVDLKKAHLGLVGSRENVHEQLKILLMQLTFFQSYHDLQIIFIHSKEYKEEFAYLRWYPHLRIRSINAIANISDEQVRDQLLGSVQQILKERKLKKEEEKQEAVFLPHFLFVIDEPKMVLNHAIMEYLQSRTMGFGFSIIYTTDQKESLPENMKSICLLKNSTEGLLLIENGIQRNKTFQLQKIKEIQLENVARTLGALQHEQGVSSKIPESVTFFDLYGIEHPYQLGIKERWEKHQSHKSLAVPLGLRAEDDIVELNLHEKAHGPHGLVAGTTGSGKSEIVQAYILSLAVNFHPHEVGFLLIDYKGGGMANLFRNLPHLLGTITNLEKAESMRAMASIKSELSRRQRIFGECGVNHINGYNTLFKLGKVEEPLPHLFMISDEFAELKKEQPEFMSELISTARIGRSLGIHLILATQKPSGVVDDQIWTNSKFRLCLKVQDAGDSKEMLKTPDAANITQAGRAYLQVGNNEIYELFQSAWSGASYDADETEDAKEDDRVYLVNAIGQGELINQDLSGSSSSKQLKITQLDAVVDYIREEYEKLKCIPVKKTWLPSLPQQIVSPYTKEIKDSASFEALNMRIGIGMRDIPEEQKQEEYVVDFNQNGHFLYMASSGYGKTMVLTNIILGLCTQNSVENFHCYILDMGNNALIGLKSLPHVADYMGMDDVEKISKFQRLIMEEISNRKKKLAQAMVQNFVLYNQVQETPMRAILIVVDNYDAVGEMGDQLISFIQKAARDGASLGIYFAVTMTRESVMRNATKSSFKVKMAGFNYETSEINSFIGRSHIELPEAAKGRAVAKVDNINLIQLYTPVRFEQEVEYIRNLKKLIEEISEKSSEKKAKGIPTLPEMVRYEELMQFAGYEEKPGTIPLGLDMETLDVISLDLEKQPGFVIGESGMGRTNQIRSLLKHVGKHRVYLFDSRKKDLAQFNENENLVYSSNIEESMIALDRIKREIVERQEAYEETRIGNATLSLSEFTKTLSPVYIAIDIIQELYEMLESEKKESALDIIVEATQVGIYLFVTSDAGLFRDHKNKLLLLLKNVKEGVVVGSLKQQNIFPSIGVREGNLKPEIGYYFKSGSMGRIKYIEN